MICSYDGERQSLASAGHRDVIQAAVLIERSVGLDAIPTPVKNSHMIKFQAFGAMGMTKELPLQQMANEARLMRIYEGPTEVHRWLVARNHLANYR